MTTVTDTTSTATFLSSTSSATYDPSTDSALSSDFETFLKMLTVQMQNQDPLNPVDSADYSTQLATFSGVEQQVQTNDLIKEMTSQLSAMGMSQSAGWVGKEVQSSGNVYFDGTEIDLEIENESSADSSYLIVKNSQGSEVQRVEIDPDSSQVTWDGRDQNGYSLSEGEYSFSTINYTNGQQSSTSEVSHYAEVLEARRVNNEISLIVEGNISINIDDVVAVR